MRVGYKKLNFIDIVRTLVMMSWQIFGTIGYFPNQYANTFLIHFFNVAQYSKKVKIPVNPVRFKQAQETKPSEFEGSVGTETLVSGRGDCGNQGRCVLVGMWEPELHWSCFRWALLTGLRVGWLIIKQSTLAKQKVLGQESAICPRV